MQLLTAGQLASGRSPARPVQTMLGISPAQLDTLDPIAAPSALDCDERAAQLMEEVHRCDDARVTELRHAQRADEVAFVAMDDGEIAPYGTMKDLVRGTAHASVLAALVQEIEEEPVYFAMRMWTLETFVRQLHDRVARLERSAR